MTRAEDIHDQVDAYFDDELGADERAAFEAHLAGCQACRGELEARQDLVGALGSGAAPAVPAELAVRVSRAAQRAALAGPGASGDGPPAPSGAPMSAPVAGGFGLRRVLGAAALGAGLFGGFYSLVVAPRLGPSGGGDPRLAARAGALREARQLRDAAWTAQWEGRTVEAVQLFERAIAASKAAGGVDTARMEAALEAARKKPGLDDLGDLNRARRDLVAVDPGALPDLSGQGPPGEGFSVPPTQQAVTELARAHGRHLTVLSNVGRGVKANAMVHALARRWLRWADHHRLWDVAEYPAIDHFYAHGGRGLGVNPLLFFYALRRETRTWDGNHVRRTLREVVEPTLARWGPDRPLAAMADRLVFYQLLDWLSNQVQSRVFERKRMELCQQFARRDRSGSSEPLARSTIEDACRHTLGGLWGLRGPELWDPQGRGEDHPEAWATYVEKALELLEDARRLRPGEPPGVVTLDLLEQQLRRQAGGDMDAARGVPTWREDPAVLAFLDQLVVLARGRLGAADPATQLELEARLERIQAEYWLVLAERARRWRGPKQRAGQALARLQAVVARDPPRLKAAAEVAAALEARLSILDQRLAHLDE